MLKYKQSTLQGVNFCDDFLDWKVHNVAKGLFS